MVTMQVAGGFAAVKTAKDFKISIGNRLSAHVPARICHLFDRTTGGRLASKAPSA
jgi:multiple sugar transport system ATP-binding protein